MPPDAQLPATNLVPELAAFRADLEELGYVVVPHGDHLCVRLPQFASVRVKLGADGLQFIPQFGPLRRHHSSALTLGARARPWLRRWRSPAWGRSRWAPRFSEPCSRRETWAGTSSPRAPSHGYSCYGRLGAQVSPIQARWVAR